MPVERASWRLMWHPTSDGNRLVWLRGVTYLVFGLDSLGYWLSGFTDEGCILDFYQSLGGNLDLFLDNITAKLLLYPSEKKILAG